MRQKKNKWLFLVISFVMVITLGISFISLDMENVVEDGLNEKSVQVSETSIRESRTEVPQEFESSELASNGEFIKPLLSKGVFEGIGLPEEDDYMNAIHKMTHQKVHAFAKWGAIQMTVETIDEMLRVLDEANYEHETFYRETLEAWMNGDFSNAVDVHNMLWEAQGGTVGKAKRLLTPEEEAEFIKNNLK
ncbi:DUF6241 domain-containing protein [uncultured Trichococcus sp.]|uniref:DUF6241 domain-containing protein n=1 Tax=uncultured Trichococcus sp. TaxID=189665 RepID=UPI0029C8CCB2|nr:DUF6241 domain-containing protein [uncultured Trichococcus sp.]